MTTWTVVGGGISGLWAAIQLARNQQRVRLIERTPKLGGLAGSHNFRGIDWDLGSHRIHPEALNCSLFSELHHEKPFLDRPRRGRLVLGNRWANYPPGPVRLARALGARTTARYAAGFAMAKLRTLSASGDTIGNWESQRRTLYDGQDEGFAAFVTRRAGRPAYEGFYQPYAQKVWGVPASELSHSVAKKRISTSAPLRRLARSERFAYPPGGLTTIMNWLHKEAKCSGVELRMGESWSLTNREDGPVLFSGSLTDLVPTPLSHRGLYLIYLAFDAKTLGPVETWYSHDPAFWFGRVSQPGNYSPSLRRPGETVLCVEIPEGRWGENQQFSTGDLLAELLKQLRMTRIVPPETALVEAEQRFIRRVYPLYRRGWIDDWNDAMESAGHLENIYPFGRQGLFLHCNLDHCVRIADDVVSHALKGLTPRDWLIKARSYLAVRVRD